MKDENFDFEDPLTFHSVTMRLQLLDGLKFGTDVANNAADHQHQGHVTCE